MSQPQPLRGYKVFRPDFTCRDHQFSENSEHTVAGQPVLCSNGFHFCQKPNDCFNYYEFDPTNIICEVEALGNVAGLDADGAFEGDKVCTNHIRIGKRLNWHEVLTLVNIGKANTGRMNTGDRNTGNLNTGDLNTGNRNTGDLNTGNRNTGDRNTGNLNTGDRNTGNRNTGNRNTGDRNTGNRNTGNRNTGDLNTGDLNTGNWNTGNWNTGNHSAGIFCTKEAPILFFDAPSGMTYSEWRDTEAAYLMRRIVLTEWISWGNMSDQEKEQYPRAETAEGYLKRHEYKAAHATWWDKLSHRERALYTALPNFEKSTFLAITGIDIDVI